MRDVQDMKLHELPAEVRELEALIEELEYRERERETWPVLRKAASEDERVADQEEREALERRIEQLRDQVDTRWQELAAQLDRKGEQFHRWLRQLQSRAAEAEREAARVRVWAQARGNALDRVKRYVHGAMEALGMQRLDGATWRLRIQANGGRPVVEHDGETPVPLHLAAAVALPPERVVRVARELGAEGSDAELLERFGIPARELRPDMGAVCAQLQDEGELPAGFAVRPRGTHLRVE